MRCFLAAFCILPFLSTGCQLAGTTRVLVTFPSFPPQWEGYPEKPGYILTCPASENGEMELYLPPYTENVTIYLGKGNNTPVLLTPFFDDGGLMFRPAGALYPLHCTESGVLPLSWEDGFLADLIFSLHTEDVPVEHINCVRMSEVIGEAGNGDPWSLDKGRIIQALRFNSFRQDYVSPLEIRSLDIELSEECYLWNDPFLSSFQTEAAGVYTFDSLYEGEHILFPMSGSEPVRIVITGDGWFIFYPEYAECGNW